MFVAEDAKEHILNKRKSGNLRQLVQELVLESERLQITEQELMDMIKAALHEEGRK